MLKEVGASGQISLGKKYAGQLFDMQIAPDGAVTLTPVKVVPMAQEEPATYTASADGSLTPQRLARRATATARSPKEQEDAREQWEAEGGRLAQPRPTSPSDWHPVAAASKEPEPPARERPSQKLVQNPPEPDSSGGKKKPPAKQGLPRSRKSEGQGTVNTLNLAKSELDRGDIPEALMHYGKLIKRGKHLEETSGHLSESLYRYPVEVGIWQTLGDAYMRANRLKEALDAYNKAEELIR